MRTKSGIVTSAKMKNTVTVTVHRYVMHATYLKRYRVSKKFLADTAALQVAEGDEVVISECRPLSKRKCFKVTEVKRKARVADLLKEETVEQTIKRDHRDELHTKKKEDEKAVSPTV